MSSPRREYLATLLLGVLGAAIVLGAVREGWARVVTAEPHPLPAVSVSVSGQDVLPAAAALGLAALAGLAAVLATRRLLRRIVGGLIAAFGAGIAIVAGRPLSSAQLRAAATHPAASVTGGSTMSGGTGGPTGSSGVSGLALSTHVVLSAVPWRPATVLGAALIIVAGLLVAWRGARWPVMSGRYERIPGRAAAGDAAPAGTGRADQAGGGQAGRLAEDPAVLWESLNHGVDPTDPAGPTAPAAPGGRGGRRAG